MLENIYISNKCFIHQIILKKTIFCFHKTIKLHNFFQQW